MCKSQNCNHNHKINRYGDFILESKAAKLILEGNLVASQKFLSRLLSIKQDPIADKLYKAFSSNYEIEKDLSQNWVDVTDKDDTVTFMGDRSAARLSNDPEEVFSAKGRNEIKVGRLARAILTEMGDKVLDKDIEVFVNTYKASKIDNTKRFELVNGSIIKKYYNEKNYADQRGTLGDSCMKGDDCQTYFKIYTKNENECSLLVYLDENGKVLGRALVWKLYKKELYNQDQTPYECPATYFMDRVYTNKDSDVIKFINYAKEKNWLYKWKMTADDMEGMVFRYNDKVIFGRIVVKLGRVIFRKYPFVDTLNFCDGDQYISNVGFAVDENDDDAEEGFLMNDTCGDSEPCSSCDGSGYENSYDKSCRKCDGDGDVNCPDCRGRGGEICKKCGEGNGRIMCTECEGGGDIDCTTCNGNGNLKCKKCNGEGHFKCKRCNAKGSLGKCKKCNGQGDLKCDTCHGQPFACTGCQGQGKITKKWGRGTRLVTCPECNGDAKSSKGDNDHQGCRCPECGENQWGWNTSGWVNTGKISCEDCEDGEVPCPDCSDNYTPGEIECSECGGDGEEDCPDCRYGTRECPKCEGEGDLGTCDACNGRGTIGKCKNPKCENGTVECPSCEGSGERPKGQEKELCEECSGLLDKMKKEIESGDFKFSSRD